MMTCPQCGAQNLPGMAYCENCGSPLPQQSAPLPGTGNIGPVSPPVGGNSTSAPAPAATIIDTPDPATAAVPQGVMPVDQLPPGTAMSPSSPATGASAPSTGSWDATAPATAAPTAAAPADAAAVPSSPDAAPALPVGLSSVVTPTPPSADEEVVLAPTAAPADQGAVQVPAVPSAPAGQLTITFPSGQTYAMQGDEVNVGRADVAQNWRPELDLIPYGGGAPDLGVSRHHARLVQQDGTFSVVDVGSTNGTYVNGHAAPYNQSVPLHDGDTLSFGAFNTQVTIR